MDDARDRLLAADHGVLATVHAERGVDVVPVCFAVEGDLVAVPVDRVKPKRSTDLQRARNLAADPRAALLVEQWDPVDWSQLWWVRASLVRIDADAAVRRRLEDGVRRRYPQYGDAPFAEVLVFRITTLRGWAAR